MTEQRDIFSRADHLVGSRYTGATGKRILAVLDRPPPTGFALWTGGLIAAKLGDLHEEQVWRFQRGQKIWFLQDANPGGEQLLRRHCNWATSGQSDRDCVAEQSERGAITMGLGFHLKSLLHTPLV
jgi:hypothetical protein